MGHMFDDITFVWTFENVKFYYDSALNIFLTFLTSGRIVDNPEQGRPQREEDIRAHRQPKKRIQPTQRSTSTPAKPTPQTPKPRPPLQGRKNIDWYEESHSFALKASVDSRLLIRHAPIPLAGSPWPMPQHYDPDKRQFLLDPRTFKFQSAGEMCDILR